MPFVPVPNVVQCNVRYTLFEQQIENVIYVDTNGVVVPTVPGIVAQVVGSTLVAELLPELSEDIELREVYAVDLTDETGPTGTWTPPEGPVSGGIAQSSEPGNVAWVVSFRTVFRGRSFRGRNYIAGIPDAACEGNNVTQVWATAVLAAYQALGSALLLEEWEHVVVSRISNGAPRTTGIASIVTAYVGVDTNVDSQRRRLPGRGN